jgi:hypothetical protein
MLKQELDFKAIGTIEFSPTVREPMKPISYGQKKVITAAKANAASASALERPSGVGSEARNSRDSAAPREQDECWRAFEHRLPSEPVSRRSEPGHLLDDGPEAQGTMGELASQSIRQLGPIEGRLVYATAVVGVAMLQQPSWPHKP